MEKIRQTALGAMVVAAMALPVSASATVLTFSLDVEFSGATPPAGATPWITATFDDSFGGANTVRLTMSATNLVGTEFISEWSFNFDPGLDPTLLTFAPVSVAAVGATTISTGVNAFQADGDGKFDILFDFPPPPGTFTSKFTAGETVIYDLTYVSPITVAAFDFGSAPGGGQGTFKSAAHIQGIGASGNDSGWIGPGNGDMKMPEPASLMIFAFGLMGLGFAARRRLEAARM